MAAMVSQRDSCWRLLAKSAGRMPSERKMARSTNPMMNQGTSFRIIAVTGWGQDGERSRAKDAGFDVHLVKPVDLGVLAKILDDRNGATLH